MKQQKIEEYPTMVHKPCDNTRCPQCMESANRLLRHFSARIGNEIDTLGHYHSWLALNDIPNESEHGWFSVEAFERANIDAFVSETLALNGDSTNEDE